MLQNILMFILGAFVFAAGVLLVGETLYSAIRTFVLPRSAPDALTRFWFRRIRWCFGVRLKHVTDFERTDSILALYAPVTLVSMPFVWLCLVMFGYTAIYWALGALPTGAERFSIEAVLYALRLSGSSMLTLGVLSQDGAGFALLMFSEAAIGLILVALLIAYLPTLYSAFSKREALVSLLEVRTGAPPSPVEMFRRIFRFAGVDDLKVLWLEWELWFTELEETHTSLPTLAFFRSQQPTRSWITAAGIVLDAAALQLSAMDLEDDGRAALTIRAGFLALRRISDFFGIRYDADPQPTDKISVTRAEFDAVYDELAALELFKMQPDREQAWRDFAGWRVNYDVPLVALAELVVAPYAPWSSDRGIRRHQPRLFERLRAKKAAHRQEAVTETQAVEG